MSCREVVCLAHKGCGLLPFHTRIAVCLILIAEATFLGYNLAVRAPIETFTVAALTLACAVAIKLTSLRVRPNERTRLKRILEQLQGQTGLGQQLKLQWIPNGSATLAGEVRENIIYLYDASYEEEAETLIEEFVEYCIAEASKPYITALNSLIKSINEEAYRRRDKAAKAIAKLLKPIILRKIKRR